MRTDRVRTKPFLRTSDCRGTFVRARPEGPSGFCEERPRLSHELTRLARVAATFVRSSPRLHAVHAVGCAGRMGPSCRVRYTFGMVRIARAPRVQSCRIGAIGIVVAFGCTPTPKETATSPPREPGPDASPAVTEVASTEAARQHVAGAEIYVPPNLALRDGQYDLIVHFHGIPKLQEDAVARAHLSAVVVSVNVGSQSGPYGSTYKPKSAFPDLLDKVDVVVHKNPHLAGAKRGRLALTAWSSGASAVMAVLANGTGKDADAVLLADGLFTSYIDPQKKTLYRKTLEPVAEYAERAKSGSTLFVLTHTSIATDGYPGMPETAAELLRMVKLEKSAPKSETGAASSKVLYEVHQGAFHVTVYDGRLAGDHISQIKHMDETVFSYLHGRWQK